MEWQEAERIREELAERSRYKDMDLAILMANGEGIEKAAVAIGMKLELAKAIVMTPMFSRLLGRLRKEREQAVYSEDPDEGLESEARGNYLVMRQARDMGETMGLRLKAAQMLHEARPSVRRQKLEESTIKVVFAVEDTRRLLEGFAKATGRGMEEIEAEFKRVEEEGRVIEETPREAVEDVVRAREMEETRRAITVAGEAVEEVIEGGGSNLKEVGYEDAV
jgi:hypothetical protein